MKVSVLIDGGYLHKILKKYNVHIDEKAIHTIVTSSLDKKEILHKIVYYDCRPYKFENEDTNGEDTTFEKNNQLLDTLAKQDQYVLRLGKLMFLGRNDKGHPLLVQKGVDIRIALDIARIIMVGKIDRLIIITGDTDLVPAMQMARSYDIQIVAINIEHLAYDLYSHSDFVRTIDIEKLVKKKVLKKFKKQKALLPAPAASAAPVKKPTVPRKGRAKTPYNNKRAKQTQ